MEEEGRQLGVGGRGRDEWERRSDGEERRSGGEEERARERFYFDLVNALTFPPIDAKCSCQTISHTNLRSTPSILVETDVDSTRAAEPPHIQCKTS